MNMRRKRVLSPREEMVEARSSLEASWRASGEASPPGPPPPAATRAKVAAKRMLRIKLVCASTRKVELAGPSPFEHPPFLHATRDE